MTKYNMKKNQAVGTSKSVSPTEKPTKLKTRLLAGDGPINSKLATNHNTPVKAESKVVKVVKTRSFLPRLVTNHNAPVKPTKKPTKLKTRLVAGDGPINSKLATNHNSRTL
ncbi:MAG: hypothetical protein ABJE66_14425 [Deltaproteobacteria bacterium]